MNFISVEIYPLIGAAKIENFFILQQTFWKVFLEFFLSLGSLYQYFPTPLSLYFLELGLSFLNRGYFAKRVQIYNAFSFPQWLF